MRNPSDDLPPALFASAKFVPSAAAAGATSLSYVLTEVG